MRYSKQDVTFHRVGYGGPGLPAINVKVHEFRVAERDWPVDETEPAFTSEWYEERVERDQDLAEALLGWACESAWDSFKTDVRETFGQHVKVWQEGRSGGWAVVEGLPHFESWDAIMVARWGKLERYAREYVAAIPAEMAVLAYLNVWLPEMAEAVDAVTLGIPRAA